MDSDSAGEVMVSQEQERPKGPIDDDGEVMTAQERGLVLVSLFLTLSGRVCDQTWAGPYFLFLHTVNVFLLHTVNLRVRKRKCGSGDCGIVQNRNVLNSRQKSGP